MIALATSKNAMELSEEDLTLLDALAAIGVQARLVDWTDPSFNWASAELVVVRTTWDYHLQLPAFLDWARKVASQTTLVNPYSVIEWNANKRYLADLHRAGVPIVPTLFFDRKCDFEAVGRRNWSAIVVKPAVAAGAYETLVFEGESGWEAASAHCDRLAERGEVLVQPYIDGITVEGETSLVFFDGEFHHAVRKVPKSGDFRVQIEFGGKYTVVEPRQDQLEVAAMAVDQSPERPLYARVDLVDIDGGPHVMELELIEPELFFLFVPEASLTFADLVQEKLEEGRIRS